MSFIGSYVWQLRQVWGTKRLLIPGAGMFIMTPEGKLWMGKRSESGEWSYFGGAMELGDSIMDTVIKEVLEETGLETKPEDWTFVGTHSNPAETNGTYPNGDEVQIVNNLFTMVYDGELGLDGDDEHTEFAAFALDALPTPMKADNLYALEVFKDFVKTGKVQAR